MAEGKPGVGVVTGVVVGQVLESAEDAEGFGSTAERGCCWGGPPGALLESRQRLRFRSAGAAWGPSGSGILGPTRTMT